MSEDAPKKRKALVLLEELTAGANQEAFHSVLVDEEDRKVVKRYTRQLSIMCQWSFLPLRHAKLNQSTVDDHNEKSTARTKRNEQKAQRMTHFIAIMTLILLLISTIAAIVQIKQEGQRNRRSAAIENEKNRRSQRLDNCLQRFTTLAIANKETATSTADSGWEFCQDFSDIEENGLQKI
ncbi:Hypothetical predicted protein [Olea europaea subsp. europaea]|uniref:Uncharacterized protein n=1 Tax=Olea europaea subsp. europaea TaxID=158383 RepID=A0A8S0RCY3_OLEEU|nr:Hypothetical predicted protein [Olea europaea subsp. europaea]